MAMTFRALFSLLAFGSTSLATSVFSEQLCLTKLGTSSLQNIPSSTLTINIPLTAYSQTTTTPIKTITPAPTTSTITSTTILTSTSTATPNTQTVTQTLTGTSVVTSTATFTATDAVTSTVQVTSSSTTSIPTPAGFTPISQENGYVPKIRGRSPYELAPRGSQPKCTLKKSKGSPTPVFSPKLYPTAVKCIKFIESVTTKVSTATAKTTSTTTLAPVTSTATSLVTKIVTTTTFPSDVTSTATTSTTVTSQTVTSVTTTTTTSTTTTVTVTVPGPTVYAGCASNNVVSSANGGVPIEEIASNQGMTTFSLSSGIFSPEDCCTACFQQSQSGGNCAGSAYGGDDLCYLLLANTCSPGDFGDRSFETDPSALAGESAFYVSNGPCGAIADGGNV